MLTNKILSYYLDHIEELPEDKQFHFASRLAAWNGDEAAYALLKKLKPTIDSSTNYRAIFTEILHREQSGQRNAHERRVPYFAKYPDLYGVHLALFRLRHLKSIYGIDATESFFACYDRSKLKKLLTDLVNDKSALRNLSTFAINTLYLSHKIALPTYPLAREHLYNVGFSGYDMSNKQDLQLFIYYYTHCIIGESNFYTQLINETLLPLYTSMLEKLESVIHDNFTSINLDNKLEFLVCARICNYKTDLEATIYDECDRSVSDDGVFLIDKHNDNIQNDRMSFEKSEHRNVLFIMSSSEYNPHATIV